MNEGSHFYTTTGEPRHFIPKKDGSGNRPSTIADCRKNGWVPSPTTVLKLLAKPGLQDWLIKQSVHAVVTAPDVPGEGLDAKIDRILNQERQQDEESRIAADRGTQIHDALHLLSACVIEPEIDHGTISPELSPWVFPAWNHVRSIGTPIASEIVLVGDGYAGRTDLIIRKHDSPIEIVVDYKTTGKLPEKGAWPEHRIQLSAYSRARSVSLAKQAHSFASVFPIGTANLYISTKEPGRFVWCDNSATLERDYAMFRHLLEYWRIANNMDVHRRASIGCVETGERRFPLNFVHELLRE